MAIHFPANVKHCQFVWNVISVESIIHTEVDPPAETAAVEISVLAHYSDHLLVLMG